MDAPIKVNRLSQTIYPDLKRVISRFFYNGDNRALQLITRIFEMDAQTARHELSEVLIDFAERHRDIEDEFIQHFNRVANLAKNAGMDIEHLEEEKKLLIGAYFTHEYSIEAAAFFNPSITVAPDQSNLQAGQLRLIMSLRATGEGHISSIEFRYLILEADNRITIVPPKHLIEQAEIVKDHQYKKTYFQQKLREMNIEAGETDPILDQLPESFTYSQLRHLLNQWVNRPGIAGHILNEILWLADSHHEMRFSAETDLSERIIFPTSEWERKGIEDARWVRFSDTGSRPIYYGTYTAFDGKHILPKLIKTEDFTSFDINPLYGKGAQNKNLALFPRKINNQYAMLSRIDGRNNYITFSKRLHVWENPQLIMKPAYPWEYIQIGNCGSPIETSEGWLVLTHGVGPMRKYCIGAALLDLDDPTKVIGRLNQPLLQPSEDEREGYVPNVVYSCGSIVHKGQLILPYAASDYATTFATVSLQELLSAIKSQPDIAKVTPAESAHILVDSDLPSPAAKSSLTPIFGRRSGKSLERD